MTWTNNEHCWRSFLNETYEDHAVYASHFRAGTVGVGTATVSHSGWRSYNSFSDNLLRHRDSRSFRANVRTTCERNQTTSESSPLAVHSRSNRVRIFPDKR